MSTARQLALMVKLNLRSLPKRAVSSLVIVAAMAGVAGVLIAVLALSRGLLRTLVMTGHADRAIVLRAGTDAEEVSLLPRDVLGKITAAPGVAHSVDGAPIVSTEMLATTLGSVTIRGVSPTAWSLRPEIKLVQGRSFRPGLRELLVGEAAQQRFPLLAVGRSVKVLNSDWLVVGAFAGGGAHDAELMGDVETLMSAYRRTTFNAITVKLDSPQSFGPFRAALNSDPAISVAVGPEWYYYEAHSQVFSRLLALVANAVGGIMAIGAIFAAMNTMYAAVAARAREIGTLRAIGFGAGAVVGSVLIETLLLAILGALVGAGLAWLVFGGRWVSTVSGAGISNVIFRLNIAISLVFVAVAWAALVGLAGGLLPALRAARLPADSVLRAV